MNYKNNISKDNELNRKKLIKESENLFNRHEDKKEGDDIKNFKKQFSLLLSSVVSLIIGEVIPYILSSEDYPNITLLSLLWLIPVIIVGFVVIYCISMAIMKGIDKLRTYFTASDIDSSNEALQEKIDMFDVNITYMIKMFYESYEEYGTKYNNCKQVVGNGNKKKNEIRFNDFLQVRYYLFKAISQLSQITEKQMKGMVAEDKYCDKVIGKYRNVDKIEKFRLNNILQLVYDGKDMYVAFLNSENFCDINNQAEINYLDKEIDIIRDATKFLH